MDVDTSNQARIDQVLRYKKKGEDKTGGKRKNKDKKPLGIVRAASGRRRQVTRKKNLFTFTQQHVPDIPTTRTSDLQVSPPMGFLSHIPTDLTPPAKNPNRSKITKRKHDEVNEADDSAERRKMRVKRVDVVQKSHGMQPPAEGSVQEVHVSAEKPHATQKPAEKPAERPVERPVEIRWKRKNPLLDPVATPVPAPAGSSQNSNQAIPETSRQHLQPYENALQEDEH
ncbi:hypothetical protein J3459_010276 [Metarhizium acridum]|nr:hypothetical protein J3459_010276 [Metarhizium acridum]